MKLRDVVARLVGVGVCVCGFTLLMSAGSDMVMILFSLIVLAFGLFLFVLGDPTA